MALNLNSLRKVRADKPPRFVIYGPPGIGKTSLAAEFPNPVFLQTEDGTPGRLELSSFGLLQSFSAVMDAIGALYSEQHDFSTLVLDSLSELEKLVYREVCTRNNWKTIEQPGYGKGYAEADYIWQEFLDGVNALRNDRGMAVVLIAHAVIERFDDPTTQSYSRYDIDLHRRAKAIIDREVDAILLIKHEVAVSKEDQGFKKTRGIGMSADQRWIYTEGRPSYIAKTRYPMPERIPYRQGEGYQSIAEYLPQAQKTTNTAAA